jgi:predicted DNA-binding protein with PD1-like motif
MKTRRAAAGDDVSKQTTGGEYEVISANIYIELKDNLHIH